MKKIILLTPLFFILCISDIFSQNIKIRGKVNKSGALIRLMTFNDMLTYEQTTIFETRADDKGNFFIDTNIDETKMAQIAVDLERTDILLSPNSTYEIEITIPEQEQNTSYFEREKPELKIIKSDDNDLYYQYHLSNVIIDDFMLKNFNKIYRGNKVSLIDSLDNEVERELGKLKSGFVKDNLRYRKATLRMTVSNSPQKIINQYFDGQKILYSNPAYMELFQEIFSNYLKSQHFSHNDLMESLRSSYNDFKSYLNSKDAFLAKNENLAEIIIAWNLKNMFYEMPDERKQILDYLKNISQNSKNHQNKVIVKGILNQINRLSYNSDAPQFSLKDEKENIIKLSDYKDDIIILQFVNQVSTMTDYQFKALEELALQWQDSIKIFTIATKESFSDFSRMFKDKGYDWMLLNLGEDILLLEKYQIKTFPDYIILKGENKIGMAPAPSPDQYLDFHVRRISKYHKK